MSTRSTTALSSATSSPSESDGSSGGSGWNTSFVGSTPSTVLFFLALAAGALIALLFIFFTMRYFVRSKYGLHVYSVSHRNIFLANIPIPGYVTSRTTNQELQEQLAYIRDHHSVRGDILERMIRNRRRRRRRSEERYTRMTRLTQEEVDSLFPRQTYERWLDGGKERDRENRDGVIQEESDTFHPAANDQFGEEFSDKANTNERDVAVSNERSASSSSAEAYYTNRGSAGSNDIELDQLDRYDNGSPDNKISDLHFTSGFCSICLDNLSQGDLVRGLLCGHVFHADCLDPWLVNRKACCPLCKRSYYRESRNTSSPEEEGNNENDQEAGNDHATEQPRTSTENRSLLDLEIFRNDPSLMAMIQELIPNSERVRMIVNERGLRHLRLEERANEIADKKFSNIFKRVWWKLMGIKKIDLYNWAVIHLYHDHYQAQHNQQNAAAQNTDNPTSTDSSPNSQQQPGNESSLPGRSDEGASHSNPDGTHRVPAATPDICTETPSGTPQVSTPQSPYDNSSSSGNSERDIVHQRV